MDGNTTFVGNGGLLYTIDGQMGARGKFGGLMTATSPGGRRVTIKRVDRVAPRMPALLGALRGVDHPGIAPIVEVVEPPEGGVYVVREMIEGTDLKTIFTNKSVYRRVEELKYLDAGKAILRALDALHKAGVVHRDVKPSNVIIPHAPGVKVQDADFSRAVLIDFEQCSAWPDTSGVRASFALVYSPPEMLLKYNELVGPWSDLFALSVMLFQLIMGKAPYSDCNPEVLVNLQLTYPMKQPARMDDALFACLSRAAHKAVFRVPPRRMSPDEIERTLAEGVRGRYQTAADMLADLEKVRTPFKKLSWVEKLLS